MRATPLLAALQLGDSAFPSGAFTQSYGLETLVAELAVANAADVETVLAANLRHRLARADLPALLAAHRAAAEQDAHLVIERRQIAIPPAPAVDGRPQGVLAMHLVAAIGGEDHDVGGAKASGRIVEELTCRRVGPLQVFENEQKRVRAGGVAEQ